MVSIHWEPVNKGGKPTLAYRPQPKAVQVPVDPAMIIKEVNKSISENLSAVRQHLHTENSEKLSERQVINFLWSEFYKKGGVKAEQAVLLSASLEVHPDTPYKVVVKGEPEPKVWKIAPGIARIVGEVARKRNLEGTHRVVWTRWMGRPFWQYGNHFVQE